MGYVHEDSHRARSCSDPEGLLFSDQKRSRGIRFTQVHETTVISWNFKEISLMTEGRVTLRI